MRRVVYKFAASTAMVMCAVGGAQAWGEPQGQEVNAQASHSRFDDFDRWKQLVVLAAFVDVENETVTLRGLNFGKKSLTVFCETERMKVLKASDTEVVVRFPKECRRRVVYVHRRARQSRPRARSVLRRQGDVSGGRGIGRARSGTCGAAGSCRSAGTCWTRGAAGSRGRGGCCWSGGSGWRGGRSRSGGRGWRGWTGWSGWAVRSGRSGGTAGRGWNAWRGRCAGTSGCTGTGRSRGSCGPGWWDRRLRAHPGR